MTQSVLEVSSPARDNTMTTINSLRCEFADSPACVDTFAPRLSWEIASEQRGWAQGAYRIWVASHPRLLKEGKADRWDSGRVESRRTARIAYAGKTLRSGERCFWKVQVWDQSGESETVSETGVWSMGILYSSDWKASWISASTPRDVVVDGRTLPPCAYLRRKFTVDQPIKSATIFATARGLYEMHLNGARLGDSRLSPGWTDYDKRIQYQSYDVTALLRQGGNALGAVLGDGWYSGYLGFDVQRDHYGDRPQLLAQLVIEYADGARELIVTDGNWRAATGPIDYSDFLMGEQYDARKELIGWDRPEFSDASWRSARVQSDSVTAPGHPALVGDSGPPIRVTQELRPIAITQPAPGAYLFDLGQNMVGWARLAVTAPAGTRIQMRFAEMLNPDGTLYTTNLRAAKSTDVYICRGDGVETYEPRFTFHGFRYVEVTGYPGEPSLDTITGCFVGSDAPDAGTFECSDPMVNQLQSNIVWGQRGNFLSIPTDCPQRDERLGWMGDAQIFVRTATYNRDVQTFFNKWIQDVEDAQAADGGYPDVAPRRVDDRNGAPAWGDAGVIVPWTIYHTYGDTDLISKHWASMTRWMDYLTIANPSGLWENERHNDFGDWLSIDADTPKDVLATAYYAYDAALMARMARAIGRREDAATYDALFTHIKNAFHSAYVTPDGKVKGETQTCYVLALRFGLLPENLRPLAAKHLTDDIAAKNGHLSTGFVGVGYLCPVLTETGYNDIAYQLLLNDTFPSWGYSIRQGATTIWERWDGWTKEKGFQDPGMNSFNHYSLGSVGQWLYQTVAGIDTEGAGFERIVIAPRPGPGLTYARATYHGTHGPIASAWDASANGLTMDVSIPANATATVFVPTSDPRTVTEGGRPAADAPGVRFLRHENGRAVYAVGSGTYTFAAR
ncbi:alpha-L-rhamnosidase [Capsulimonas corticalis]|uniref:alpha-L-rhamnosidase n=2 Tax=Capsulimonas corticalis TaxID=2219043 RepID=A0A402CUQ5_9BACT|nr:alpha-L-rhamnosidase [Capsulimonas corticalis]